MLNSQTIQEIEALLKKGSKIQLEYQPKKNMLKLFKIDTKKISVKENVED